MSTTGKIYLDNNATTRMDERVLQAMLPFFTETYENAGSSHLAGITVQEHIENAVWEIAELIGARPEELIFTSGATEAINLALRGISNGSRQHFVSAVNEHKAVLDTVNHITGNGNHTQTLIPVHRDGLIDFQALSDAVSEDTLMVNVMMVNNETGTLQDIRKISEMVHAKGAFLLCDATQAVGKIPADVKELGIDLMPFSAHKFYGPKGTGALYVSGRLKNHFTPQITGGGQQNNRRSGTLNVPGIIGMGKACEIAQQDMQQDLNRIEELRDYLEYELLQIEGSFTNGSTDNRICNTTNICFPGVLSEQLIMALKNISVSSGSACSSVTAKPSHVLVSLGLSDEEALSSIRFSLGRFNTKREIHTAAIKIRDIIQQLR